MEYGKYIIIKWDKVIELAIIFDNIIEHVVFLRMYPKEKIVSAGFFTVGAEPRDDNPQDISVSVHGKSTTLGIESRGGQDERLIKRVLRKEFVF